LCAGRFGRNGIRNVLAGNVKIERSTIYKCPFAAWSGSAGSLFKPSHVRLQRLEKACASTHPRINLCCRSYIVDGMSDLCTNVCVRWAGGDAD